MAVITSTMLPLDSPAPNFVLPEPFTGNPVSLADFGETPGLLVVFLSNHCPFVKHLADHFAGFAAKYQEKGVAVVGINANDVANYPEDSPEKMKEEVRRRGYTFPYLFDASQEVAKAYKAACTPDFYFFGGDRRLVYRGRYDGSRPSGGTPVTGSDLGAALDAVLASTAPSSVQLPSAGCNIKWKAGNEPPWFG